MDIKYFGDNFIPGLNVKNVNAGVINPLMNAGAQVSKAYGEYGENLRQALGQETDDFSKQFLAGKIADKKQQKTGGNITRVGGKTYRMDNPADVKALKAVLAADKASRPGQKFADLRGGGGMTTQTPPVGPVGPPSPSADPRNAEYLNARGKLTEDSTAEDIKKVEDIGMTAWAKANPKLAAKVKPGQSGYGVIQGLEKAKDQSDLVSDMQVMGGNKEESEAKAGGGIVEVDIDGSGVGPARISPQGFKDSEMAQWLNYGNTDYEPIVEGLTIPTTTNYAGAFNQADTPDLQSMINMGDQLGNLGMDGPTFTLSQKFKDLFQNSVLGK